ncbi:hypothetical protein JW899_02455 [Candidatus Uhrbacteria bacterium]|nr:hypothetical protein [Candidatus Uhrbacteria bacterium]
MRKFIGLMALLLAATVIGSVAWAREPDIPDIPTGNIGPTIESPAVPGISAEAREMVPDGDFVEIYCLTAKWKSGEFLAALEAVEKHLMPAVREAEELVGNLSAPDVSAVRTETVALLDAICSAQTVEVADAAVGELVSYGEGIQGQFSVLRDGMASKLRAKGESMKAEIEAAVNPMVEEEKAKAQAELDEFGERLGAIAQSDLAAEMSGMGFESEGQARTHAEGRIAVIRREIEGQVQVRADQLKREIEEKVRVETERLVGPQRDRFEDLGRRLGKVGNVISAEIAVGKVQYERYGAEAMAKRLGIALKVADRNIERGLAELESNRERIEDARRENPGIKPVGDITEEIRADRAALAAALESAVRTGDEVAFQSAIDGFRGKWENYRAEAEKAFFSVSAICAKTSPQFVGAKARLDEGMKKITDLQDRCGVTVSEECRRINELAPRLDSLLAKMTDVSQRIRAVEEACGNPDSTDPETLIDLMNRIKADGEELNAYGQALEAEKSKVIAESAASVCAQILPQLTAAKVELRDNDLARAEGVLNRCRGQQTEECTAVNESADDLTKLRSMIDEFVSESARMESLCRGTPDEAEFAVLRDLAEYLKSRGETIRVLAKDLQQRQAEKSSLKAVCASVNAKMEIAKREIAKGLGEATAVRTGCQGKADGRCAAVNAAAGRFTAIENRAENVLNTIAGVTGTCRNPGNKPADESFLAKLETIRSEVEELKGMVAELKAEGESRWPELIRSGKRFLAVFDVSHRQFDDSAWTGDWRTDPMGTIRGGETYTLKYSKDGWSATGINEGTGKVGTWTYRYGDPDAYQLDIWGRIYEFDAEGNVYDPDFGLVGHLSE